jgi:RNA-directed DNA polymerase
MNWIDVNWTSCELKVYNLQCKIFKASKNNSIREVRKLQRELIKMIEAKFIAVRRVSQDNAGKQTPGIDGRIYRSGDDKSKLAKSLVLDGHSDPIKRVYIPKGTQGELRPLGLPTIRDRSKQMLVTLALEPEWEARFDYNSYGFRPGYSAGDARWMLARQIQNGPKFVLDADIEKCFDNISHDYLMRKLGQSGAIESQILAWLQAKVIEPAGENKSLNQDNKGTPQGGIISPLLANVTLNGMEDVVKGRLIRYADDFIVLDRDDQTIEQDYNSLVDYFRPMGLSFNDGKTSFGHTMDYYQGRPPGFDFLGFHYRNYHVSKHSGVKNTRGKNQDFITVCRPSNKSVRKHKQIIRTELKRLKSAPIAKVIKQLSKRITGWAEYFSLSQSTKTFTSLDGWLFERIKRWGAKRSKGTGHFVVKSLSKVKWRLSCISNGRTLSLKRYDSFKVKKWVKVKKGASYYDGSPEYYARRLSLTNSKISRMRGVLVKQQYNCAVCKGVLTPVTATVVSEVNGKLCFVHDYCQNK